LFLVNFAKQFTGERDWRENVFFILKHDVLILFEHHIH
jgi:hypothetical protein